jgi:hypothetical protein
MSASQATPKVIKAPKKAISITQFQSTNNIEAQKPTDKPFELGMTDNYDLQPHTSATIKIYTDCILTPTSKIFYSITCGDNLFNMNSYISSSEQESNNFFNVILENSTNQKRSVKISYVIFN